ncbi:MAG TPA: arginine decarboxylase, pyruvoyl-dependent [Candidatus Krumholzibacteria bacterium]|nr:arginine decarboxylase, pyruvoyl-dependent [Candidatus Krumholzibacteria bacterium]
MELVPREMFLTKGVGRHKEQLTSFELALRDAGIAHVNLVTVSSIFPPQCKLISKKRGGDMLHPGQIVFCVMSRLATEEAFRMAACSIGVAIPGDAKKYGYLSEHHSYGQNEKTAGDYAEDLAASMLASTLGIELDLDRAWDQRKKEWKIGRQIVRTSNICQTALGKDGVWTTVIAAGVFCKY